MADRTKVVFWYRHQPASRWDSINDVIARRHFANSECVKLTDESRIGALAWAECAAIFIYGDYPELVERGTIREIRRSTRCPIVVFGEDVEYEDLGIFRRHANVSFIPYGPWNFLTALNIVQSAVDGAAFLPFVLEPSWFRISGKLGRLWARRDDLQVTLDDISASLADAGAGLGIALGTLSLPRSGSKALADRLAIWTAPRARVFHSHNISDKHGRRLLELLEQARRGGRSLEIERAQGKVETSGRTRDLILNADRAYLFLVERDPVDRLRSEFMMKYRDAIGAAAAPGTIDAWSGLREAFVVFCENRFKSLNSWYQSQFSDQLGLDILSIDRNTWDNDGYGVLRNGKRTLVVFRLESCERLLNERLPARLTRKFQLVSLNSSADRNYRDAYQQFLAAAPFPSRLVDILLKMPVINILHGRHLAERWGANDGAISRSP